MATYGIDILTGLPYLTTDSTTETINGSDGGTYGIDIITGEPYLISNNNPDALFNETDPVFILSPAATITEGDIENWNNGTGGGTGAGGSNGDFQYNSTGTLTGNTPLTTDTVNVNIGTVIANDFTQINPEGWVTKFGLAKPWKELHYDLTPKEGVNSFTSITFPPIVQSFANNLVPVYKFNKHDGTSYIPFSFQLPADYENYTPVYFHIHYATPADPEGGSNSGIVTFIVNFLYANIDGQQSRPTDINDSNYNSISSVDYINDSANCLSWVTAPQITDVLGDWTEFKKNMIIKGTLSLDQIGYGGDIYPLYIDIDYISNESGKQNIRPDK